MNKINVVFYNFYGDIVYLLNVVFIVVTLNTYHMYISKVFLVINTVVILGCFCVIIKHKQATLCDIYTLLIVVLSFLYWLGLWFSKFTPFIDVDINVDAIEIICYICEIVLRIFFLLRIFVYLKNKKLDRPGERISIKTRK